MAEMSSLLSHLALKCFKKPELFVTEGLGYLLAGSQTAHDAVRALLLNDWQVDIGETLYYDTQKGLDEGGLPDVRGLAADASVKFLIEGKFGAGLTPSQPLTYLKGLAPGGVLLFVVPSMRKAPLWAELRKRVADAGIQPDLVLDHAIQVEGKTLAIQSWRSLLMRIRTHAQQNEKTETQHTAHELLALCSRIDSETFLPLADEEVSAGFWKRIVEMGNLATTMAGRVRILAPKDVLLRSSSGSNGAYGTNLTIKGHSAYLHADAAKWAEFGAPLWLSFPGLQGAPLPQLRIALKAAGLPYKVVNDAWHIPLPVAAGREWDQLVADIAAFLPGLLDAIPQSPTLPALLVPPATPVGQDAAGD